MLYISVLVHTGFFLGGSLGIWESGSLLGCVRPRLLRRSRKPYSHPTRTVPIVFQHQVLGWYTYQEARALFGIDHPGARRMQVALALSSGTWSLRVTLLSQAKRTRFTLQQKLKQHFCWVGSKRTKDLQGVVSAIAALNA